MEKFKYAPGMPGYGSKGTDGSTGLSGLAIYVTDYDATSVLGINKLSERIWNNQSLFVGDPAPYIYGYDEGRRYQTGDMFVDITAAVFEISLDDNPPWNVTTIQFGGGDTIFTSHGEVFIGGKSYIRYANVAPAETQAKLVDTYISPTVTDYINEKGPLKNYNIPRAEFGNIYFNDIGVTGSYNAFNLWTSSEDPTGVADDEKAISLVRNTTNNNWRFGNTDNTGTIRSSNPTLSLDFSKVGINRSTIAGPPNVALEIVGDVSISGNITSANFTGLLAGDVGGPISTTVIQPNVVTYAKIQNITASKLLGNPTAAPAVPSEISIGAGLNLSVGGVLSSTLAGGTVTLVSVISANGFAGSVAHNTTTPEITLSTSISGILKGNGTTISAALIGTDYVVPSGFTIHATDASSATSVGGSSAVDIHAAELLANTATNVNTVSTIVRRDGAGGFNAGTIGANLNGNADTATNLTPAGNTGDVYRSNGASPPSFQLFTGIDGGSTITQIRVGTSFTPGSPVEGDLWVDTN